MKRDTILWPFIVAAVLLAASCGAEKKLVQLRKEALPAEISLAREAGLRQIDTSIVRPGTLIVEDPYGKQVVMMQAVRDESGEMTATDVLDAAVVTARFRNVAERHGMVNLNFQITVPRRMQDKDWQVRFYPLLFTLGDSTFLSPVIITGERYRQAQLKGYEKYNRYLASISADSLRFLHSFQMKIFRERKTDVDEPIVIEHYTDAARVRRNSVKISRKEEMFRRWVKSPLVTEGLRLDSVITGTGGDIVYHYAQTILASKGLKKAEIALEGEIFKEDRLIYDIPRTAPLTFYISSVGTLCDNSMEYFLQDSTAVDTVYRRGVRAIAERDYKTAVEILKPYRDYNCAVALSALDYNASALDVLEGCPPSPRVEYLRAILHARRGEDREAVECYLRACHQERAFIHRGNLDPEIASLIRLYNLQP